MAKITLKKLRLSSLKNTYLTNTDSSILWTLHFVPDKPELKKSYL